jgi:hypothetical protein
MSKEGHATFEQDSSDSEKHKTQAEKALGSLRKAYELTESDPSSISLDELRSVQQFAERALPDVERSITPEVQRRGFFSPAHQVDVSLRYSIPIASALASGKPIKNEKVWQRELQRSLGVAGSILERPTLEDRERQLSDDAHVPEDIIGDFWNTQGDKFVPTVPNFRPAPWHELSWRRKRDLDSSSILHILKLVEEHIHDGVCDPQDKVFLARALTDMKRQQSDSDSFLEGIPFSWRSLQDKETERWSFYDYKAYCPSAVDLMETDIRFLIQQFTVSEEKRMPLPYLEKVFGLIRGIALYDRHKHVSAQEHAKKAVWLPKYFSFQNMKPEWLVLPIVLPMPEVMRIQKAGEQAFQQHAVLPVRLDDIVRMSRKEDPWDRLGIDRSRVTLEDVKEAYYRCIRVIHEDALVGQGIEPTPQLTEAAQRLNEAYDLLRKSLKN